MKDRNENRPGYKKTKVGWIPEEWGAPFLDKVAERATGHTPNNKKAEYWNGAIKWVSLADSDRLDKPNITYTAKTITDLGIRYSSARLLPAGTVIMLRDASVGRISILGDKMAVSQHFVAWICTEILHNLFLYYWLFFNKSLFQRMAVGSTIVTIGMPFFKILRVPAPRSPNRKKSLKSSPPGTHPLIRPVD